MKVVVNLPEEVVEAMGGLVPAADGLIARLHALPNYRVGDRIVVVDNAARHRLEAALNSTLDTPDDLVKATERLAVVKIGTVERPLTPGEAERIKAYAASHQISEEVAMHQFLDPLLDQWLEAV